MKFIFLLNYTIYEINSTVGNAVSIQQPKQTTVVYIPFHNQHAGVVRLIQHFGEKFIEILKTLMTDVGAVVSKMPEGNSVPQQVDVKGEITYDQFIDIFKQHVQFYRPTQLDYLVPIGFQINDDGHVSLACEHHGDVEEQGVPKFVKAVYNNPVDLVDDLISGKEQEEALWDFLPIAFVEAGE